MLEQGVEVVVGVEVREAVGVEVGVSVTVEEGVMVGVAVDVIVSVDVTVTVGVEVGLEVEVGVPVAVPVKVCVQERQAVGVEVTVAVSVGEGFPLPPGEEGLFLSPHPVRTTAMARAKIGKFSLTAFPFVSINVADDLVGDGTGGKRCLPRTVQVDLEDARDEASVDDGAVKQMGPVRRPADFGSVLRLAGN